MSRGQLALLTQTKSLFKTVVYHYIYLLEAKSKCVSKYG